MKNLNYIRIKHNPDNKGIHLVKEQEYYKIYLSPQQNSSHLFLLLDNSFSFHWGDVPGVSFLQPKTNNTHNRDTTNHSFRFVGLFKYKIQIGRKVALC